MLICDKEKKEEKKGEGSSDSAEEIEGGLEIKPCLRTCHLNNEIDKKGWSACNWNHRFF